MTNPGAAVATAPQSAAAAAEAAAAESAAAASKHSCGTTSGDAASGCGAVADDGDRGGSGSGAVLLVGTSSGMLHGINCSSGQQVWQVHIGSSISTAVAFCPVTRAHALPEYPAVADSDALAASLSQESPAAHEQAQTHTQRDCSLQQRQQQQQQQSSLLQQAGIVTKTHSVDCLLVSCANYGAVRVWSLPAVASSALGPNEGLLHSGQQAAIRPADEEVKPQHMPSTRAAVQMPGDALS